MLVFGKKKRLQICKPIFLLYYLKNTKKNLVLIGVYSFLGWILESMQALVHYCFPFLDFFGQVMHFCKSNQLT
jgi:hypothetical protein